MDFSNAMDHEPSMEMIGWREWLSLPDIGVKFIKAKIDTGARSSSLHAASMELYEVDGQSWVRFSVHPIQRNETWVIESSAPVLDMRSIRSSSGQAEVRPVIRTAVSLHGRRFKVDLTLADRNQMGFRMLLGREAVRGRFLIDPGQSYLSGKPRKRKHKP